MVAVVDISRRTNRGEGMKVGDKVFIRTVTYHYTGECVESGTENWLRLTNAAWIPNSGRLSDALRTCNFKEVEPYPNDVLINADTIVDVTTIDTLPTERK